MILIVMSNKKKVGGGEKEAVKAAIESIGLGYDLAEDLRLKYCKRNSAVPRLIVIENDQVRDLAVPGRLSIRNVPKSIKCDKGERLRFASDVLSFQQVRKTFLIFLFGQFFCNCMCIGGLLYCFFNFV